MAHLTLAGLSEDGKRLLLVGDNGDEYTLDADNALRAALRGEHARIGQLEITMDSALRPRDIQARIRAGESAESVAQAAQTTVERIMPFAAPVLAERAHVAQRAQLSSVRRRSGETGARTLGEAAAAQLRSVGSDPSAVEWDAWRREDGRWTLVGVFTAPKRAGTATFAFDVRGNFVTVEDDHARWLVGEQVSPARACREGTDEPRRPPARPPASPVVGARRRAAARRRRDRDGARRRRTRRGRHGHGRRGRLRHRDHDGPHRGRGSRCRAARRGLPRRARQKQSGTDEAGADKDAESPTSTDEPEKPAAEEDERPARRPARKGRGRASVPSWDEIMFGGGKSD